MTVICFDLLFRHPSEQREENLSRERESCPKYDSNNTDTREDVSQLILYSFKSVTKHCS
jgi:hypothetical protein